MKASYVDEEGSEHSETPHLIKSQRVEHDPIYVKRLQTHFLKVCRDIARLFTVVAAGGKGCDLGSRVVISFLLAFRSELLQ